MGVKWPIAKINGFVLFKQGEHICLCGAHKHFLSKKTEEGGVPLQGSSQSFMAVLNLLSGLNHTGTATFLLPFFWLNPQAAPRAGVWDAALSASHELP